MLKNFALAMFLVGVLVGCTCSSKVASSAKTCAYNKDSMVVVMRFERKVLPQYVSLLKKSFDACKEQVLLKEPGCLDYCLFQSYNDSTLFCITETWVTKGAHNAHMQLDHVKKHLAETKGISDPTFKSKTNYTYWVCPGVNEVKK